MGKKTWPCKSCGEEISKKAEACPHCGHNYKKEATQIGCGGLIVILIVEAIIFNSCDDGESSKSNSTYSSESKTPKVETRKDKIESQFSAWDGSHYNLERLIVKNLKGPDSYEHIETRYGDKGDFILVVTKYRARNSFGGMIVEQVAAKVDIEGNIIEIISE